jgi:paraquat-inducible protein A
MGSAAAPEELRDLIACPTCDALYRARSPEDGQRVVCARCRTVLIAPRRGAYIRVVALALTTMVLLAVATFLPFLQIRVAGLSNKASIFDAALAFSGGAMAPLAVAVGALILFIPVLRVALIVYALGPLALERPPLRHATQAFRLSEDLKPWSMAEIFVIGVAVALVKVADLAQVFLGPAFWMFATLVVVVVLQDGYMCRWSIWASLDRKSTR